MARGLKFRIEIEEGLCYSCSENKGADQLRGYREADLRLCFRIYAKSRVSHDAAHFIYIRVRAMHECYCHHNHMLQHTKSVCGGGVGGGDKKKHENA